MLVTQTKLVNIMNTFRFNYNNGRESISIFLQINNHFQIIPITNMIPSQKLRNL